MVKMTAEEEAVYFAWLHSRPPNIQKVIEAYPPTKFYRFKASGHVCHIVCYEEPEDGKGPVTVRVKKTGEGSAIPEFWEETEVFGVNPEDLEVYRDLII